MLKTNNTAHWFNIQGSSKMPSMLTWCCHQISQKFWEK